MRSKKEVRICRLSEEDLRIKVAELLGWKRGEICERTGIWNLFFPRYPNDLNVCHDMELWIQKEQGCDKWLKYVDNLRRLARGWGGSGAEVSATARERCEAFVLTMEKEL